MIWKSVLVAGLVAVATGTAAADERVDLIIAGGSVFDGAAGEGRLANVAVRGDRIVRIGDTSDLNAVRTIDASGLIVAPGFIDPHTHAGSDLGAQDRDRRAMLHQITQGVTTIVIGNDGDGPIDFRRRLEGYESAGVGVNVAGFVGFGSVREAVVGEDDRAPSRSELDRMRSLVAQAMCEGALGLSTGLYYAPQSFAETDEVIALAREAGARGGLYESHIRSEGAGNIDALREALRIGREADAPVHIAHIKALGREASGRAEEMIALIEAERAAGRRVTADQYPWTASGTRVSNALIPRWTQDGGDEAMRRRLSDPRLRDRLHGEIASRIRGRGGAETLLILTGQYRGLTLEQAAERAELVPEELARRIAADGDARLASFNMSEAEIGAFMVLPWVVTSSDGTVGHPRRVGSFARKFQRYVREQNVISVGEFVHRGAGLTADILGLAGRGYLREGYYADIAVFDAEAFAARADYVNPEELSTGMRFVVVNGVIALADGAPTEALAGEAIFKQPTEGTCG